MNTVADPTGLAVDAWNGTHATNVPVFVVVPAFHSALPLYSSVSTLAPLARSHAGIAISHVPDIDVDVHTTTAPRLIVIVPSAGPCTCQLTGIVVRPSHWSPFGV